MSDAEAVLIYATENSTQRGESSTAGTGSVAGATWLLARAIMRGDDLGQICPRFTKRGGETLRGQIACSEVGLGWKAVHTFLQNVPGTSEKSVKDYFASIKACGEYAKIIGEVRKEIDTELAEELRAAEQARKDQERAEREEKAAEENSRAVFSALPSLSVNQLSTRHVAKIFWTCTNFYIALPFCPYSDFRQRNLAIENISGV